MTTDAYRIRAATTADVPAILPLYQAFCTEEGRPFTGASASSVWHNLILNPTYGRVWVVCKGLTVVGFVVLTIAFSLDHGERYGRMEAVYLAPEHRGKGIGRAAMATLEQACVDAELTSLHASVHQTHARSQVRYRRMGFADRNEKLMVKPIRPTVATPI